jgi:hypothetical protein
MYRSIRATYQELASHYGAAILPARVRRPRDKAKVEAGVLLVERWCLSRLRHQSFFSLPELNAAIQARLTDLMLRYLMLRYLSTRPFKKLPGSRRTLFETLDKPAMSPPSIPQDRTSAMGWPSGGWRACTSITTSRWRATTTRCPMR